MVVCSGRRFVFATPARTPGEGGARRGGGGVVRRILLWRKEQTKHSSSCWYFVLMYGSSRSVFALLRAGRSRLPGG